MTFEIPPARVERVETVAVRLPLDQPVSAPDLLLRHRDYLLVRIVCDDGTSGIGFSYIATFGGRAALTAAADGIAEAALGHDATDPAGVSAALMKMTRILGRGGPTMNVISAIDIALWDRNARAAGVPLHALLGGSDSARIPAYASGGYLRAGDGNDVLADELKSYLDAGFGCIKIKTAHGTLEEDVARVRLAREIAGLDTVLMFDVYCRWTDVETARSHVAAYNEVDPYWIEDPFDPDALDLYVELARSSSFRMATGEFFYTPLPFEHLAQRGALSVIQAEAPRCGGITGWLDIARLTERYPAIELCPCWFHDIHIHLVAATDRATMVEYFPDDTVLNFRRIIDSPIVAKDGFLLLPDRPGIGYDFIEENIERYRLARPHVAAGR